ncbi:MAG: DUF547 domain-containing protein [Acidobacteriota bacterium]
MKAARLPAALFASLAAVLLGLTLACGGGEKTTVAIEVPSGIDHSAWTRLLQTYVDGRGLVDYAKWKASEPDRKALRDYLAQFAPPAGARPAERNEKGASLANAYNAFTISWILDHYPVESIQSLPASFRGARHRIGGHDVSLDRIEHETLRPEFGFLVHSVLVCAARSCPPLGREAMRTDRFVGQTSYAMLRWLAREDLNRFDVAGRRAEISSLFDWYGEDFEKEKGGLRGVLSLYAPDPARAFVLDPGTKIHYMKYDWGLNDQGEHGRKYGGLRLFWDRLKARLRK